MGRHDPYLGPYVYFTPEELKRIRSMVIHGDHSDPVLLSIKEKIDTAYASHPLFKEPMK